MLIRCFDQSPLSGGQFHKHMRLCYIIPLEPRKTTLSIYSFTDMTFCLVSDRASTYEAVKEKINGEIRKQKEALKHPFKTRKEQFELKEQQQSHRKRIFIFKTRTRTGAMDWVWQLWLVFLYFLSLQYVMLTSVFFIGFVLEANSPPASLSGTLPWVAPSKFPSHSLNQCKPSTQPSPALTSSN